MAIKYINKNLVKLHQKELLNDETSLPFLQWLEEKYPQEYRKVRKMMGGDN